MNKVVFGLCTSKDADEIVSLVDLCQRAGAAEYLYPPSRESIANWLKEYVCLKAVLENQIIGFSVLISNHIPSYFQSDVDIDSDESETGFLLFSLVNPKFRNRGVGSALVLHREELAKNMGVRNLFSTVHPNNTPNLKLLAKHGFFRVKLGTYYKNNVERVLMRKNS